MRGDIAVPFSENYIEACFQAWYKMGCPSIREYLKVIPKDEYDRTPSLATLAPWFDERGWWQRRDALDAVAATKLEDELVALKVNMLREQAAQARSVRQKAHQYILENDFDTSASAVSAFIKAAELERTTLGISKTIQQLSEMDDDEVMATVKELAERAGATEIIDAAEVPQKEDAEP